MPHITAAARSILIFGIYLVLLGAALILIPNLVLTPFGFPPTSEPALRIAGSETVIIGFFLLVAARHGTENFFATTLIARPFLFFTLCGIVPSQRLERAWRA